MAESTLLVAIDIGTTKVATLIGEVGRGGGIDVIGIGCVPSDGLRKGVVIDIDRTVQAVSASVQAAERLSGMSVNSAFVGISGGHVSSQLSRGMVAVSGRRAGVAREDTVRAIDAARAVSIPNTREIIHVIPRGYVVDGQDGVRDPIGMSAVRLEVETLIVTASTTSLQNLSKCVQRAGVEIEELVLTPLATAEATLSDEDRELGTVLADIGGDTTDLAILVDGTMMQVATLPVGGKNVTNDLGLVLKCAPEVADGLKLKYGTALPLAVDPDEVVHVTQIGDDLPRPVMRRHIAEIVESRMQELFELIAREIDRAGVTNRLQAGIVLTGGGALLPGAAQAARDQLNMSARVVAPRGIGGLTDQIAAPSFAAATGLLLYGSKNWSAGEEQTAARAFEGVGLRVRSFFRALIP
jgi:cell division protein FtsA